MDFPFSRGKTRALVFWFQFRHTLTLAVWQRVTSREVTQHDPPRSVSFLTGSQLRWGPSQMSSAVGADLNPLNAGAVGGLDS